MTDIFQTYLPSVSQQIRDTYKITTAPDCWQCRQDTRKIKLGPISLNGGPDRYYYKCTACRKFAGFADMRGISERNPACICGPMKHSRAVIHSERHSDNCGQAVYFKCVFGRCGLKEKGPRIRPRSRAKHSRSGSGRKLMRRNMSDALQGSRSKKGRKGAVRHATRESRSLKLSRSGKLVSCSHDHGRLAFGNFYDEMLGNNGNPRRRCNVGFVTCCVCGAHTY